MAPRKAKKREPKIRLYHRTTPAAAEKIRRDGMFTSKENGAVFFSTALDGQAGGYGEVVVAVDVPVKYIDQEYGEFKRGKLTGFVDDEFPSGEKHWSIPASAIDPKWIEPEPPVTTDEILDLIGGNTFNDPKPKPVKGMVSVGEADKYRQHRIAQDDPYVQELAKDIAANGIREPLQILTDGNKALLTDGNHRLSAAQSLGMTHIPVELVDSEGYPGWHSAGQDVKHIRDVAKNRVTEPDPPKPTYREHLLATEDSTSKAHVIMPTELVDRYREYQREPGGKDYRSEYEDVLAVIEEQGIRQPLWISTDGKTAMLVEGNNRLAVAKELGIEDLPVRITYDKETRRNEGVDPAPLDPDLKSWVEENRIREDYRGKTPYGSDAFPDKSIRVSLPERIGFGDTSVGLDAGFPTITKPSRKSRSYLNPAHREDVLAKAGAISTPYRNAVKDIQHRVTEYVRAAYKSNPSFLTNHEDIDRLTALMAPALAAGQMQIADLTNAHLANLFGLEDPPSVDVSKYGRPGVTRETELSRPFWTAIKAAREGKSTDEALAAGMRRMEKMLATDFQMAKVIQSRDALKAAGVQQYSRVAGPKACWLCAIAATQVYYTEDLLPIHPGCGCDVAPVPPGGQKTLDSTLDPELLLTQSADQVKLMTEKVESGASPAELRDLVAVREHGETGPQLTWAHQKFTGPDDLPVPMPRDVLAQEAYDTVRENGGITIDLAGHQPPEGYAYAPYKTTEFKVSEAEFTPKHIDDYVDSHFEELSQEGNHLGMWVQNGYVYLDVSKVGPPDAATFAKAQAADQLAVFDLGNFEEINLGTIDETGEYRSLGEATDLHNQYREQVARADQGRGEEGVPGVPGSERRSDTGELTSVGLAPIGHEYGLEVPEGKALRQEQLSWDGPDVAKPSRSNTNFSMALDQQWRHIDFDIYKENIREGARAVQNGGYKGLKTEANYVGVDLRDAAGVLNFDIGLTDLNYEWFDLEGRELAARAIHSKPTKEKFFRGMVIEKEHLAVLDAGDEISLPASSFGGKAAATRFATNQNAWISDDVGDVVNPGGVIVELEPGAKLAQVGSGVFGAGGEMAGFGRFEVVSIDRKFQTLTNAGDAGDYVTKVVVRHTSLKEYVENSAPATGPVGLKIPEYTIIQKPLPNFNTIDLKTGKPDTAAERITKVQPGKIPDYGNSAAAGMQLHARHPNLQVDFSDIDDPDLARSSAQALDDMLTKYPESKLHSAKAIPRFKTPSRYAQTDLYSGGDPSETVIEYNKDFYGSRKKLEKSYAKTVDIGYHPTKGKHDAAYAITVHEFAHSLDATGSYRASGQARDVLRKEFLRLHPEYKGMTGIVEQSTVRQKYDEWLTSQLSDYATTSGRGKYGGHRLPGDLNPSEAIAEAFAHVELDPDNATDAERALHKLVVDSSKLPPRKMSGAGWQSGVDTPEKVVENKEKRRARKAAEAPRPDGVFRDEYGDKWWSLDGQTYESRIDYENAVGHKEVQEREAQITAKVGDVPLYLRDGVDAEGQKEIERTITRLQKKYPNSGLRQVTTPRPDEYADRQDMAWTSGVRTITVNPAYFGDSEKLTAEAKRLSNSSRRYNPRLPQRHSGAEQTIIHEFGHVLDYQGLEATHKQASKALKEAFLQDNPKYKKLIKADREAVKTAYQKWLEDGLSAYSFQGGHHGYNARLDMGEAIAEAFCDVEMNGDKASRASHVLHDLVVKNAEPEAVAAAKEKRRLKRLKEIQENNRVYKKSPEEIVAEKEAKRAAAEAKKAAAKAAAAAKRAEDAGQIFDPKIFGKAGKPKNFVAKDLPREDIKSIRRFGGVDFAAEIPVEKGKPKRDKKTGKLKPPQNDWNGTWEHLPPIMVDLDGNIVDEALEANLRLVMAAAEEHPWVIVAGDRWYPDYSSFVRHQWEMVGQINPVTGKPMTWEQALDASGAYAINVGWNATMADTHNWMIGKPNPKDGRNAYADEASQLPASLTDGRWVRRVRDEGEARKINDFTLNGKGDLSTSTTDRVMSRLALGTDDAKFAAGLLGATNAGSYVDPKTGKTVKLSGYERISQAADRVSIQMGAPNEAAGQARMWIEFFGPEAAYGLPPDDVVAEGLESINAWVRQQLDDEANVDSIPRVYDERPGGGGRYNPYKLLPSR